MAERVNQISVREVLPKKREYWIDVMRAFACIMVLFCHSPQPYINQPGQILMPITNYYGMAWGPILFFMISGACIMYKEQPAFPFLRKRFSRILIPTVFWSIIYIILECKVWHTCPEQELWSKIFNIPLEPQYGLMWFMYALISIYLMTPILSKWLHRCTKRELELYLLLWGITLLLPYVSLFGESFGSIIKENGLLFYFSGFLWVAVLGFYCRKNIVINVWQWWHILIIILVLLSPLYIFLLKHFFCITISSSLSVDSIATTALAFLFFQNMNWGSTFRKGIQLIAKYSFGIYLTHMLLMHPFRMWISQLNLHYAVQIPLTVVVVGAFAFIVTAILSKLPFSKYLIG